MPFFLIYRSKLVLSAAAVFIGICASAQWQSRNSIGVSASLTDKLGATLSHMRTYNASEKFAPVFSQTAIVVRYDATKRIDLSAGLQFINVSNETRTRLYVRGAHTSRLKAFNWTNSLRLETNSANEHRFRQRIGLGTRISPRKRLDALNLMPSLSYQLFFNIGGHPIRYYNDEGQLLARQTPDGLHRNRFTLNLNSKVSDVLRIDLYYMRQQEFNLFSSDTRKMNVYDPRRNRLQRPFNHFNAIGLSFNINLDPFL